MKKRLLFLIALFAASMFVMAEMTIYVYKKDGTKVPYVAAEVDSVGFTEITHEYVDLGLSVMWATCNVGANTPEERGFLYQWGDIIQCGCESNSNYKWYNSKSKTFFKYVTNSYYGIVDEKTELEYTDDVANVYWLGNWRMPSKDEMQELIDNCTYSKIKENGIEGYRFFSKINGNSIFLPIIGENEQGQTINDIRCWTNTGSNNEAYMLTYNELKKTSRFVCASIRPVYSKEKYRYTICFNANGANGGMESVVVNNGNSINLPKNVFYLDGTFIEWNTKPDGTGTSYADRAAIAPTEDMVLYAQWKLAYDGIENGHKYVDLGLSVKWATSNLVPYFSWGETETYDGHYNVNKKYSVENNSTVLELEDDAAHVNWGGGWRMPTKEEIEELINPDNCTWKESTTYPEGYTITSKKNGNSIFLPSSGFMSGEVEYDNVTYYWSSTLSTSYSAYILYIPGKPLLDTENCSYGCKIRPVLP